MNITDIFIRRPVLAVVVSLVITIAGVQAVLSLNVRQYPRSGNASVTVNTTYVGASAQLVRGFITTPLNQTSRDAAAANQVFMGVAETEFTFQITPPASGFGGMVVSPWRWC